MTSNLNILKQLHNYLQQFSFNDDFKNKLNLNNKTLMHYCEQIIDAYKSMYVLNNIISCFSVGMTDEQYEEWIYDNLNIQLCNLSKCQLDCIVCRYKALFNPQISDECKFYLNNMYNLIIEMKSLDFSLLSKEQKEHYNDKIYEPYEEFEKVFDLLDTLFAMLNNILILFSFNYIVNVGLIQSNYIYKDLYYSVKGNIDDSDYFLDNFIDESLTSNCETLINNFNISFLKTEKYLKIKDNKEILIKDKDFKLKYNICKIIQVIFIKTLEDSLYETSFFNYYFNFEAAEKDYLGTEVNELLKYASSKQHGFSINKKNVVLSAVPIYLNKKEFLDYIYNIFESITDNCKRNDIVFALLNVFQHYDFIYDQ